MDYLQNLLQSPFNSHLSAPYTKKDIDAALSATKDGKAAEDDGIFPKFLQTPREEGRTWLAALFTTVHETGQIVAVWKKANVIAKSEKLVSLQTCPATTNP